MMRTLHVTLAATVAGTTGFQASAEESAAAAPDSVSALSPDAAAGSATGFLNEVTGMLQSGGPVVAILLSMSVISLAIVLAKLVHFRALRYAEHDRTRAALGLWQSGQVVEAARRLEGAHGPLARLVNGAMLGLRRGIPEEVVRKEALRLGGETLEELRSWFRPLEVIATLAPLLGLFGTVLGMIEAFRQLEAAGNQVNPAILSGGIWEALLTTAVGLAVAIPTVAALNWLERRAERFAHDADSAVTRLFTRALPLDNQPEVHHAVPDARHPIAVGAD